MGFTKAVHDGPRDGSSALVPKLRIILGVESLFDPVGVEHDDIRIREPRAMLLR